MVTFTVLAATGCAMNKASITIPKTWGIAGLDKNLIFMTSLLFNYIF